MPGSLPEETQPFLTYRRLYSSFVQRKADSGPHGCSIINNTHRLCGDCLYRTYRPTDFSSRLFRLLVPSVYAAELDLAHEEGNEKTISERVSESRPKIYISDLEIEEFIAKETGRDRLREMYTLGNGQQLSSELALVFAVTKQCALITFVLASFRGSLEAREEFIRTNKHTKFASKIRASRRFNDAILLGGLKTGVIWAVKTMVFTTMLMGTSQSISVYRNKTSPLDFVIGGGVSGALYRINLGLRGLVAGGIIGSVFGLIAGLAMYGVMAMNSETQEQRHYWYIQEKLRSSKEIQSLQEGARAAAQEAEQAELPS